MKKNKIMGYIAIILCATIYGVSYLARNLITDTDAMHPTVITFFQLCLMGVLFLGLNIIKKRNMKIAKQDILRLILSGFFGTFLTLTLCTLSVAHVGAGIASMMTGLMAIFSLIINAIFFKKKANALGWIAALMGLAGLFVIMGVTADSFAKTDFLGYAFCVGSMLAWVIYTFLADKITDKYENSVLLFWNAVVGIVASIPFLWVYPVNGSIVIANIGVVIFALVVLGIFNATFAYFLNIYAIKQIGVNQANMFLNFQPIFTVIAVLIVYHILPKGNEIIGGLIIIASAILLSYAESKQEQKAQQK